MRSMKFGSDAARNVSRSASFWYVGVAYIFLISTCPLPACGDDEPAKPESAAPTEQPSESAAKLGLPELVKSVAALSTKAEAEADFSLIIDQAGQILESKPDAAQAKFAHDTLGWGHNRRGQLRADTQPADALADFEAALQHTPDAWRPLYNRAISLAQAGRLDEAQADLEKVVQAQPAFFKGVFNRAEVKFARGDVPGAMQDYDLALRLDPQAATAYVARGFARLKRGQLQQAMDDYGRAINIDPKNVAAYVNRGDAFAEAGQYSNAAADYRKAIELDGRSSRAYVSWGWLMATCPNAQFRNAESGVKYAQYAVQSLGEENYHYQDVLAAALANAGRFDEARQAAEKALSLAPESDRQAIQERQALYASGAPYRVPAR